MRTCQWCGKPAVGEPLVIEPTQYRNVTKTDPVSGERITAKEVAQFAITADVCQEHRDIRDREGGTPIPDPRRKKAQGVEQVSIFDVLDDQKDDGPGNAIYGEAA